MNKNISDLYLKEFTNLHKVKRFQAFLSYTNIAQLAGAGEYTDCISAKDKDSPNECPAYDTKQFHSEVLVMLEFGGMWSTPSLPLLPGPLWPRVVAPDRVLSRGQIELKCVLM